LLTGAEKLKSNSCSFPHKQLYLPSNSAR
jgi:hypothetical protein